MNAPWWFQGLTLGLNAFQTVALAYVYARWRSVNGQVRELTAAANRAADAASSVGNRVG